MKGIDDFISEGWEITMNVSRSAKKKYNVFLFGNKKFDWQLVGEGDSHTEMMSDLIECEKKFADKFLYQPIDEERSNQREPIIFRDEAV